MSIESRSQQYGVVFDHWQIKDFLGSGSGGKSAVFRLSRIDSTWGKSALKVINLIEEKGNIDSISDYRRREYEQAKIECKKAAEQEVRLMDELHGNTNIVDYLDHKFVDWSDETGFGCDMLIRMELLEDLRGKLRDGHQYSEKEVLKIGRDICAALVLCHQKGILHRDIKPENIFINADGNFKLGDFGVSRILSAAPTAVASTGIGTPEYAAPEQFTGRHDKRVDIYSLGLVLYELTNGNKLPFASTGYARPMDVERRQMGEPLPAPCNASKAFTGVILKACAYKKEERYQTAEELLAALDRLSGTSTPLPSKTNRNGNMTQRAVPANGGYATERATSDDVRQSDRNATVPAQRSSPTVPAGKYSASKKSPARKGLIIGIILVLLICIGAAVLFGMKTAADKEAIAGYIDEAESLAASFDYEGAISKIEEGLDEYPNSTELQDKKDTYVSALEEKRVADIVIDVDSLVAAEDYTTAISKLESSLETYPGNTTLQAKLEECTGSYTAKVKRDALEEAKNYAGSGDFKSAMASIEKAKTIVKDDEDLNQAYDSYYASYVAQVRTAAQGSAAEKASSGDYLGAHKIITDALIDLGEDEELAKNAAEYENSYVAKICTESSNLANSKKYTEAESLVKEALAHFPENEALKAQKTALENAKPAYLLSVLDPYKAPYHYNDDGIIKMGGTTYAHGFTCMGYGDAPVGNETFFNLEGKYSEITFTAGIVSDSGSSVGFMVYADGELIYGFEMKSGSLPTTHTVPIPGCKQLVFAVYDGRSVAMYSGTYGIADIMVTPIVGFQSDELNNLELADNEKYLLDCISPYEKPYHYHDEAPFSMGGNSFRKGFTCMGYGDKPVGNQTYFNLNGAYSELSFTTGIVSDVGESVTFTVYADGEYLYSTEMESGQLPTRHTVSVEGCKQLIFAVYDGYSVAMYSGTYGIADITVK